MSATAPLPVTVAAMIDTLNELAPDQQALMVARPPARDPSFRGTASRRCNSSRSPESAIPHQPHPIKPTVSSRPRKSGAMISTGQCHRYHEYEILPDIAASFVPAEPPRQTSARPPTRGNHGGGAQDGPQRHDAGNGRRAGETDGRVTDSRDAAP